MKRTDAAQQDLKATEIAVHQRSLTAVEQHDASGAFQAVCDHMDNELRLVREAFGIREPS